MGVAFFNFRVYTSMGKTLKLGIKSWSSQDKPREKIINGGIKNLTDTELIAVLFGSGAKGISVIELSRNLLHLHENNLSKLSRAGFRDLLKINGIGHAKASIILSVFELARRINANLDDINTTTIRESAEAYRLMSSELTDLLHEEFWIVLLNRANRVIQKVKISSGGVSGTVVDTKLIMKHAIQSTASSIILYHNHPSGNLKPSQEDIRVTAKLAEAGKVMDIKILDHIIIGDKSYYSFLDEGLI